MNKTRNIIIFTAIIVITLIIIKAVRNELNQAFFDAATNSDFEKAKHFVEKGADVNFVYKNNETKGTTVLMLATQKGLLDIVQFLVNKGANVNTVNNINGTNALMLASQGGYLDIVRFLVDKGAKVNAVTTSYAEGGTALILAARERHWDIVKFLIDNGADVNIKTKSNDSIIREAIYHGDKKLVQFLIDQGAEISIHLASYAGLTEKVQEMIKSGSNINEKEEWGGNTPLQKAVEGGNIEMVKLLIDNNAEVNIKNNQGETPLKKAVEIGYTEIAKILIAKGADINVLDNYDRSLLHTAACSGHSDIVELLLESDINVNSKDKGGHSALDYVLRSNFTDIIKLLGGDINNSSFVDKGPYTVIISDQNDVSNFLKFEGYDFDMIWIPEQEDIEGLEQILKNFLMENLSFKTKTWVDREYILSNLRSYNREYSGYILDNQKYIICQMTLFDGFHIFYEDYEDYSTKTPKHFSIIFDGGPSITRVIYNFREKSIISIDCNGE